MRGRKVRRGRCERCCSGSLPPSQEVICFVKAPENGTSLLALCGALIEGLRANLYGSLRFRVEFSMNIPFSVPDISPATLVPRSDSRTHDAVSSEPRLDVTDLIAKSTKRMSLLDTKQTESSSSP